MSDSDHPDIDDTLASIIEILGDIRQGIESLNENIQLFEQAFVKSTNEYTYPNFR